MELNLTGKVFFISGSSRGIGFGIAKCFLEEGAKVIVTGRNAESLNKSQAELDKTYQGQALYLCADMSKRDVIFANIEKAVKHFGQLDGVVANIGSGQEPMMYFGDDDLLQKSYDKNVKANLLLAEASIPHLKSRGGTITFTSSIAGVTDLGAPVAYSIHKAALNAGSKRLSRELASLGIRVNSVAPGNILFADGAWEKKLKNNSEAIQDYINKEVPLKCFGEPEDIGYICIFLASNKAKFITGSLVVADGGQTRFF